VNIIVVFEICDELVGPYRVLLPQDWLVTRCRLNVNKSFSGVGICSGRGFASVFGLGSGHDRVGTDNRVIQRRVFMGTHLGKRVDVWNCGSVEVWK